MCGGHNRGHLGRHMSMRTSYPESVDERRSSPIDVLNDRLVRGEITVEEYQKMRAVLDDPHHTKQSSHIRKPMTM